MKPRPTKKKVKLMKSTVRFMFDELVQKLNGYKIGTISLSDDTLSFGMYDGYQVSITDDGQDCCETRFMRTDDDLQSFIGAEVRGIEIRTAPDCEKCDLFIEGDDDRHECHEVQFLVMHTTKGELVMSSHNNSNGYYCGFKVQSSITNITEQEFYALLEECKAGKHRFGPEEDVSDDQCFVCDKSSWELEEKKE